MKFNLRGAIVNAVVYFVTVFALGVIVMAVAPLDAGFFGELDAAYWTYVSILVLGVLLLIPFSAWFFRRNPSAGAKHGLFLGLTYFAVMIIPDLLIAPFYVISVSAESLIAHYSQPMVIVGLLLTIGVPAAVGYVLQRKTGRGGRAVEGARLESV